MGKKSKRNRGASRVQQSARVQQGAVSNTSATTSDVAAAAVGREIELMSSNSAGIRRDPIDCVFEVLQREGDHKGILKLESKFVLRATALEGTEPNKASYIYFMVAKAYFVTGFSSRIARNKAIHYFERAFALSDKEIILHECVRQLLPLYLNEGRHDEAFVTVKRLAGKIPQHELIDPDLILSLANELYEASLNERAIDILTMFLGTMNRSWDKDKRAKAYLIFGQGYIGLAEYEKGDSFFQKALAITDDPVSKVNVLCSMGSMSSYSCNYDDALAALNQALEICSSESTNKSATKSWSGITALVHTQIGDVLSEQGKHDFEALESFERALVIIKEVDIGDTARKLGATYHGIGVVQGRLGNWDQAIKCLKLAHSCIGKSCIGKTTKRIESHLLSKHCEEIGRVRLDQYLWDERLRQNPQERKNVLMEASIFSQKSIEYHGSCSNNAYLNYAQVAYFIHGIEEANKFLMSYFEAEMNKLNGICCRTCKRTAGKGADIKICRSCQVVDYCSLAHQTLAWRRGRLSHKVMCPFLKRYRLVAKAENRIDTESVEDICKDFFETVCVFKYEV
jgi:tetratricopeptide (TPR) repeat protein